MDLLVIIYGIYCGLFMGVGLVVRIRFDFWGFRYKGFWENVSGCGGSSFMFREGLFL